MAYGTKNSRDGRVIKGSDKRDVLKGGQDADEIFGKGGDDLLIGRGGDDLIDGGEGDDTIFGRGGANTLIGGAGDDEIFGGSGDDDIDGGEGDDTIFARRGDNTIDAGDGDDVVFGGSGDDVINAGDGNDVIFARRGDNVIDAGAGHDEIVSGKGDDVITAGDGDDEITSRAGDDIIDAGAGDDKINAGRGNDVIDGGAGQDEIRTGRGEDVVKYNGDPFNGVDVSAAGGQVVNAPDTLTDWSIRDDSFRINATDFGIFGALSFVNAEAADLPDEGQNVIVLQDVVDAGGNGLNARTAAQLIAENTDTPGAGLFIYFNEGLQINRLVYSSDLSDPDADISILANIETLEGHRAIKALPTFSEENFEFEAQQLLGDDVANVLVGNDFQDVIDGEGGGDALIGQGGSDLVSGGAGGDQFAFGGDDPFEGADVSAAGRQIVGGEDFISDFEAVDGDGAAVDRFVFDPATFGVEDLVFAAADATAASAATDLAGANMIVLLNADNDDNPDTPFLAGTAAAQIAALGTVEGPGFFVYFNSNLGLNRLVFSTDLGSAEADLKIVARLTDTLVDGDPEASAANAIDALSSFVAGNFELGDVVIGESGDDILLGSDGTRDILAGEEGDDVLLGQGAGDTLSGGLGADQFAVAGDAFDGADVSAPGRQIIGGEDFVTDFEARDRFLLSAETFGVEELVFAAVDANDPSAGADLAGANMIVLLNADNDGDASTPFLAGTAAAQIAALGAVEGPGFFVYFNSNLQLNRLVFSEDLGDASADLKIVARLTDALGQDAIDALQEFAESNFVLGDVVLGDDEENTLSGTAGEDVIDGGAGADVIDGLGGSDDLIGGLGEDVFRFSDDPFDGAAVDPADGVRQIIGGEDFIADFEIVDGKGRPVDEIQVEAASFGLESLVFESIDATKRNVELDDDVNVIVLRNPDNDNNPDTPFLAGTAANQIAELFDEDAEAQPGLFVYFNSNLEQNRLVFSSDLTDASADLKIVARFTDVTGDDAIDALGLFQEENFDLFG